MSAHDLDRLWAGVWPEIITPEVASVIRRARLAITEDGKTRADRMHGTLATEAIPVLGLDQVAPTDAAPYDTAKDQIAAVANAYTPGGTDVAVADGGTGSSTASGARTNLGLAIGSNVQAWDADLDTWATKTAPTGTVVGTSDSQTLTNKTMTSPVETSPSMSGTILAGGAAADIVQVWGHLKHKTTGTPSVANGAAIGTGGSVGIAIVGTDQVGKITITTGTTSLTTGTAATITFATARPDANYVIQMTPASATTGTNAVQFRATVSSSGAWVIAYTVAPASGSVYVWFYTIVEFTNT